MERVLSNILLTMTPRSRLNDVSPPYPLDVATSNFTGAYSQTCLKQAVKG